MKKPPYEGSVFISVNDYYEFCKKHGVFGTQAAELKKQQIKLEKQMYPKVKRIKK